jgi:N-acetyl-1-D-myo-inositol-2-amino-2-deoxy-alpha-D-glucopyranoside deacetylase
MSGGVLVVTAHPDDEVLIAGGTLAACAAQGLPTGVVCLTRGELGPIYDPLLATRAILGEVRQLELKAACDELGVDWVKCYRRQDGNLRWSGGGAIARQLQGILHARRPDCVITFGEDGLYYHPDHIATYQLTRRAVESIPQPPQLYRAVLPPNLMTELVETLEGRGLPTDLWDLEPQDFGSEPGDRAFALDLRPFAARKLRALRAHRTQLSGDHALAALEDDLAERFLGYEWFAPVLTEGAGWLEETLVGA